MYIDCSIFQKVNYIVSSACNPGHKQTIEQLLRQVVISTYNERLTMQLAINHVRWSVRVQSCQICHN